MDKVTLRTLSAGDRDLLRETEPARLRGLDEEELLALHARVRRARNKHAKNYRRQAAAKVQRDQSRATASTANRRTSAKAEVYEEALSRVSRALARAARVSADALKTERLAAARAAKGGKGATATKGSKKGGGSSSSGASKAKKKARTPISKRSAASARAATRRKQAKKGAK